MFRRVCRLKFLSSTSTAGNAHRKTGRFVLSNADPTRNKATAKERTEVLGCGCTPDLVYSPPPFVSKLIQSQKQTPVWSMRTTGRSHIEQTSFDGVHGGMTANPPPFHRPRTLTPVAHATLDAHTYVHIHARMLARWPLCARHSGAQFWRPLLMPVRASSPTSPTGGSSQRSSHSGAMEPGRCALNLFLTSLLYC